MMRSAQNLGGENGWKMTAPWCFRGEGSATSARILVVGFAMLHHADSGLTLPLADASEPFLTSTTGPGPLERSLASCGNI